MTNHRPPGNHACTRALERYGIMLDLAGLREIAARLASGEGMLLRRDPDGCQVTVIRVQDQLVPAVFDPISGWVRTFLPPESVSRPQHPVRVKARGRGRPISRRASRRVEHEAAE